MLWFAVVAVEQTPPFEYALCVNLRDCVWVCVRVCAMSVSEHVCQVDVLNVHQKSSGETTLRQRYYINPLARKCVAPN